MRVLIVSGGYLPGYKYGGPVRSLAALVDQLGDVINFSLVTSGSEMNESDPYPGIKLDSWTRVGKAEVFYTMDRRQSFGFWKQIIGECRPDVIYLNGFFSSTTRSVLLLRRLGLLPNIPIVLAPRGEFSSGALRLKSRKKNLFINLSQMAGIYRSVVFHASTGLERNDIRRVLGEDVRIAVAPNLTIPVPSPSASRMKHADMARFVWISRISPKKNLKGAISFLKSSHGDAQLTTFGPIEDKSYWAMCKEAIGTLPPGIQIEYSGPLQHDEVPSAIGKHDFLLFPTFGENFGHVIAEALNAGLPVLISDQTPWRNLEKAGVGWDIPLDEPDKWTEAINHCIAMNDVEYQSMSARCREYVAIWMHEHGGASANLEMFEKSSRSPSDSPGGSSIFQSTIGSLVKRLKNFTSGMQGG